MKDRLWELKQAADGGGLELYIYGDVEGRTFDWENWRYVTSENSAQHFREELAKYPDAKRIDIYINSYGGDVFEGTAIYNQLWAPFNREGTRIALLARYEIRKHLKEDAVENPVEFSAQVLAYCMTVCDPLFEKAVELLIDRGIDYVTKKDLWDRLDDSATSTDLVKAMLADKAAIEDYEKDLAVERQSA